MAKTGKLPSYNCQCQTKSCRGLFEAVAPDEIHLAHSTDPEITKKALQRHYSCNAGHANTLYWYEHYDEEE